MLGGVISRTDAFMKDFPTIQRLRIIVLRYVLDTVDVPVRVIRFQVLRIMFPFSESGLGELESLVLHPSILLGRGETLFYVLCPYIVTSFQQNIPYG